jgi:broad specificity phosphatase PhoE
MGVLDGRWSSLSPELRAWRDGVVAALVEAADQGDAVVFTHHVAINAALSTAGGDDRVRIARPDNGSRTVFEVVGGGLSLVVLGGEADTQVR